MGQVKRQTVCQEVFPRQANKIIISVANNVVITIESKVYFINDLERIDVSVKCSFDYGCLDLRRLVLISVQN